MHRTRGRGSDGNLKRVAPATEPRKYRAPSNDRAIRRSTREIMVDAQQLGRACDRRRVPFVRFERKGAGTGQGADRPALQGASNSSSLAEDTSANQFQSPCAGYSAGPIHFQRFRSAAPGPLLEGRCGEPALAATQVGTGAPTHRCSHRDLHATGRSDRPR